MKNGYQEGQDGLFGHVAVPGRWCDGLEDHGSANEEDFNNLQSVLKIVWTEQVNKISAGVK